MVRKEIDEKFNEIMGYFDADSKTKTLTRITNSFMGLVWKTQSRKRFQYHQH